MGDLVIVAYRPKPGQAEALDALVRDHVPRLRRLGLVTDRQPVIARAKDGVVVEAFEWREGAVARAHSDPQVGVMWGEFAACCDVVPLRDLAETADLFATFAPLGDDGAA